MSNKFESIPIDDDTNILVQVEAKLGDYEILYQKWAWESVVAESFIFKTEDVSNLSENELEKTVRESPLVKTDSKLTFSKTELGFTFVNFNFN
ncbi:hypothetical protein [Halopseudomonas pelagia]|uniref:Uncharacterized protein n=1 Tax=Halopseudomonas pelagia TaxID=553151 RepID=A0AA91U5Y1_9GAMM|nr:hypothetical protein [Halopseudomonas pelagia]PCD00949.1 hypothetical protein CO192_02725 [Halopseudomonas pelagia]QFY56140.1 hypothetical protein EAO82_07015 [Halopseudomonas pelagia]